MIQNKSIKGNNLKSIIFLDAVLSTKIVTLAYWVLMLINWIVGIGLIITGTNENIDTAYSSEMMLFSGIALLFLGSILIRLWAEFMVVMFKIQQNTRRTAELLNNLDKNNFSPSSPLN